MLNWQGVEKGEYVWVVDLEYQVLYGKISSKWDCAESGKCISIETREDVFISVHISNAFESTEEAYLEAATRCKHRMENLEESKETAIERINETIKEEEKKYVILVEKANEYSKQNS